MSRYQYSPLSEDAGEIRLVSLLPGDRESPIRIDIHSTVLSHTTIPRYEALSYTWGSKLDPVDIGVGQDTDSGFISVTSNLATALTALRDRHHSRSWWIDAISVNQDDLKERGRQVERMADIFQKAERVVVWLGRESPTSTWTLDFLDSLGSQVTVDWATSSLQPIPGADPNWGHPAFGITLDEEAWISIDELLSRPWFERLWIQQEIRLSNKTAILICGNAQVTWTMLSNAVFCLRTRPSTGVPPELWRKLYQNVEKVYQIRNTAGSRNLADLIRQTAHCKYTDAKDKVYSLLSHIQETALKNAIKPDYTISVEAVYMDVAIKYIQQVKSLNLLPACQPQRSMPSLPTWVPDWTVPDQSAVLGGFIAGGRSDCVAFFSRNGILSVAGVCSGNIEAVDDARIENDKAVTERSFSDISVYLQKLIREENLDKPYIGGGSILDAYCRTFCTDRFSERYHPPRPLFPKRRLSTKELRYYLQWQPGQPIRPEDPEIRPGVYGAYVNSSSQGRCFYTTKEGYIGLAPIGTQPGDKVCILIGCDVPMILRPTHGGEHKVIGECYACGLMDLEALLGPLPGRYEFVYAFEEGREYYPAYIDRDTDFVSTNDPRLDDSHSALSIDFLKARGVEIMMFELS